MDKKDSERNKKEFISEAEEILEELTGDIQQLETSLRKDNVRPELINKIFREFHSLKGVSGMLGFDKISAFTHELENMLDKLRLGKLSLTTNTVDVLYQSLDSLNLFIAEIDEGKADSVDTAAVIRKIEQLSSTSLPIETEAQFPELNLDEQTIRSFTEYEEHRLRENSRKGLNIFSVKLVLDNETFDRELRDISALLSNFGEVISTLPSFEISGGPGKMVFRLIFGTRETIQSLSAKIRDDAEIIDLKKRPPSAPTDFDEAHLEKVDETSLKSLSRTVRVDIGKLDEVMNTIGGLVVTKAILANLSRDLLQVPAVSDSATLLSRTSLDLEKKLNELQKNVIEMRLVPIGQIYNKLSRMVRKLARETNKQIDLQFHGEDTELDKIMIEELSDPLMHIIRNAIDHGIETPEERKNAGKPETGIITVEAFQRGNNVVVQVKDDGRGIQLKRIQEHARKQRLISKDRRIDAKEAVELIFTPGFSSSDEVTELSGRGVGLDVVKKNIVELKGSIDVFFEEGKGTTFEITLPITLAIINALIVRISDQKYAIPLNSISETVQLYSREIQTVDRKEVYYLRDRTIPLVRVTDVFHMPRSNKEQFYIIVIKAGELLAGLLVDDLYAQQEIVIKSIGERLKNIPGIAGATEIGEKKPILVLDPESMIEKATAGKIRAL